MRARKTDANHDKVRSDLRDAGCSVRDLSGAGNGIPDLLVGYKGVNFLFEVKDPSKIPSKRKLTIAQVEFFESWIGQVAKIETAEEALAIIAEKLNPAPEQGVLL